MMVNAGRRRAVAGGSYPQERQIVGIPIGDGGACPSLRAPQSLPARVISQTRAKRGSTFLAMLSEFLRDRDPAHLGQQQR